MEEPEVLPLDRPPDGDHTHDGNLSDSIESVDDVNNDASMDNHNMSEVSPGHMHAMDNSDKSSDENTGSIAIATPVSHGRPKRKITHLKWLSPDD